MKVSRLVVLKFVGLAVGLTAKFVTGSIFVFNVYQDAIKETYNYTQKEVELLSSVMNIGLGVGFLPGMFYDRFGPTWSSGAGLIVSVAAYLLIWSTSKGVSFYSKNSWLMAIYFFMAGLGSVFTYMVALNTNVINFDAKHTGKVVGFLNAFFAGSPSVFATVYYHLFSHGDTTVVDNQDFPGFMVFLAILFAIADLLCMAFLRAYKDPGYDVEETVVSEKSEIKETMETTITRYHTYDDQPVQPRLPSEQKIVKVKSTEKYFHDLESNERKESPKEIISNEQQLPLKSILCNFYYASFSAMFALASCSGLVYGNNITVASKSVALDYYNDRLVIIVPITNAIVSSVIGIFSDQFKEKVPRLGLVVVGCLSFSVSFTLIVLFVDKLAIFVTATVFSGMGVGVIWALSPTVMKEMFSVENLGRNWGIALLLAALLGLASQSAFGALYDTQVEEGETFCHGVHCVRGGYSVFLAVAVLSVVIGVVILLRKRCCGRV